MTKHVYLTVAILVVLVTLSIGCASTKEYARFAQSGTVYVAVIDRLLVTAGNIGIDATSERLLQDDALINQTLESYRKLSCIDEERLAIISRLRDHARLLAHYFSLLNEIATSDSPERAQQTIGGIVDSVNKIGNQLRGSELVPNKKVFTSVTKLAIGFRIRGLLREELDKRKDVIQIELRTQEELLQKLSEAIQHDLTIIKQAREKRLVIDPLVGTVPVAKPDEWIAHRRMILTSHVRVEKLATASNAARELRQVFEDIVTGKFDLERLNALLIDLESILEIAKALNR